MALKFLIKTVNIIPTGPFELSYEPTQFPEMDRENLHHESYV